MQRRYLTELEQSRLLSGASRVNDPLAQRDFHWMAALILTGMRIQEFSRLTVGQVQQSLATGWLVSRRTETFLPLRPGLVAGCAAYTMGMPWLL